MRGSICVMGLLLVLLGVAGGCAKRPTSGVAGGKEGAKVATGQPAPLAADPLLPDTERWGVPPERGFSSDPAVLPPFKGWWYWGSKECELLAAGPNLLLILRKGAQQRELVALGRPDGKAVWSVKTTNEEFYTPLMSVSDRYVLSDPTFPSSPIRRLADGTEVTGVDRQSVKQSRDWWVFMHDKNWPVVPDAMQNEWEKFWFRVNLAERYRGQLLVLADSYNEEFRGITPGTYIFLLQLGGNGKPLAGRLTDANPLPDCAEALKSFLAAPDPLRDEELMTRLVASERCATDPLVAKVADLDGAHLNALYALCVYPDSWRIGEACTWTARDTLLDAVERNACPRFVANVSRWADETGDPRCRFRLIGMLATCGGPQARQRLDALYAQHTCALRDPPKPPFRLDIRSMAGNLSSVVQDGGKSYTAFACCDLANAQSVFLGIDTNADGSFEEVLFTGLSNAYQVQGLPAGRWGLEQPKGPLKLGVQGDKVTISHHVPIAKRESYGKDTSQWRYELTGADYVTTTLSLADLRRDSDGDGLPDVVEDWLFTDPRNPDTDGDGLPDGQDPLPNVDSSKLNPLERAIQRALVFGLLLNPGSAATPPPVRTPWDTQYYECDRDFPVRAALSRWPSVFAVSLANPEDQARFQELLKGANDGNLTTIRVVDLSAPEARAKGNPKDSWSPAGFAQSADTPPGTKYVVQFDFTGYGDQAYLVDVQGELFPAKYEGAWIS